MFEKDGISEYRRIIENFLINVSSLKAYTRSVEPVLNNFSNDSLTESEKLVGTITFLMEYKKNPSNFEKEKELADFIEKYLFDEYKIEINHENGIGRISSHPAKAKLVDSLFHEYKLRIKQINILYQSSVINLIIFFELLIANLIKIRIINHPESANIEQKSLTLAEIQSLGSLENAKMFLIEHEIEAIMRKSYTDWLEYFSRVVKCKFEYLSSVQDSIIEIFQRRNIFVHNDGIVNNIYLSKISNKYKNLYKVGDPIITDREYVENSINVIEFSGILIGLEVWQKMERESEDRQDFILEVAFNYMVMQKWELALEMYLFLLREKSISSINGTIAQVNIWLCRKNINGLDSIRDEVDALDFSDKRSIFQLCLYALKDELDNFFNLLDVVIYNNEITLNELQTWPIFSTIREDKRYDNFMKEQQQEQQMQQEQQEQQEQSILVNTV
ncbi:hypothetical protein [Paenibacillus barengoltzii]|uniref:Uncharacterized protein n=1 Tax=Paenibacillus barengoltzii J12 TaxID=935846 RepID=A0ABY1LT15_9BACL|nr:hypothetical protein [Paenibacillus barengoltzii]SME96981.1 hypothetical protein SAMN02744124_00547 [Paenibacillus barengoltzii J12]